MRGGLHMGVVKAPLCNSGLSVSHLTEDFETILSVYQEESPTFKVEYERAKEE